MQKFMNILQKFDELLIKFLQNFAQIPPFPPLSVSGSAASTLSSARGPAGAAPGRKSAAGPSSGARVGASHVQDHSLNTKLNSEYLVQKTE